MIQLPFSRVTALDSWPSPWRNPDPRPTPALFPDWKIKTMQYHSNAIKSETIKSFNHFSVNKTKIKNCNGGNSQSFKHT